MQKASDQTEWGVIIGPYPSPSGKHSADLLSGKGKRSNCRVNVCRYISDTQLWNLPILFFYTYSLYIYLRLLNQDE